MSLRKKAFSGLFWTTINLFGGNVIRFIITTVLARILLPKDFGLIAMLAIVMAIASVIINGGLTQSLIRSEKKLNINDYSTVFIFNVTVGILIFILIYFLAPLISDFYEQYELTSILRVYSIIFILDAFSAVQLALLTKKLDFKSITYFKIPSLVISGSVGIFLAYKDFGVWSLVWSAISQSACLSLLVWFRSQWKPVFKFDVNKFKSHFDYGGKIMVTGLIDTIFTNSYALIIGKFFDPSQVGYYSRAEATQKLPLKSISSIVNKVTFPLFSTIQNDSNRLKEVYKKVLSMVIYVVAPTFIILAVLAEPLFVFLITDKWLQAVPYFQILCINGILFPIHYYNLEILSVKGRSDLVLNLEAIKKIALVLIIIISINYGVYGLIWGSVFHSFLAVIINTHYSNKLINYSLFEQLIDIFPNIILGIFCGCCIYLFDCNLGHTLNDFLRLFFGFSIGLVVFLTISHILKFKSYLEINYLLNIYRK